MELFRHHVVDATLSRVKISVHGDNGDIILDSLDYTTLHTVLVRNLTKLAEYQRMV